MKITKEIEDTRNRFEELVYARYFVSNVSVGSPFFKVAGDMLNKAALCERSGEDYIRPEISAMWMGWQLVQNEIGRLKLRNRLYINENEMISDKSAMYKTSADYAERLLAEIHQITSL